MRKNVGSQVIGAQMVSATDGSAFTGSVTVYVTGDAGTQSVGSVGSGACTHEGNGYHTYAPAQAETNYDLIAFTFVGTGAIPQTIQVETRVDANVTHYGATAGTFSGGRPEVNTTHWKGTAAAAVDSAGYPVVTVKSGTGGGEILTSAGAVTVGEIGAGVITATSIAANAIGASELAADAVAEIAGAVWDEARSGHVTSGTFGEYVFADAKLISGDSAAADNAESFFDGTGYAGTNNVIPTVTTVTNAVTVGTINSGVITATSIADDAITAAKIADGAIDATTFAAGAINAAAIASDAITAEKIAADAIGASELAADAVAEIAAAVAASGSPIVMQTTTIASLTSQLVWTLTAGSTDDKAYNGCLAVIADASTSAQKAVAPILEYTGATKTVRLAYDPGVFTVANGDSIAIVAAAENPVVHCALSVKSTEGTTAQVMVWMEVAGRIVPLTTIDASASCSVVVSEHDSGVTQFTATGAASDIEGGTRFEFEQATPAFTDDRQYSATATITLNSQTFTTTHNCVVIG